MADIELVIKIPEESYNILKSGCFIASGERSGKTILQQFCRAIHNGTPLPKGHTELVIKDFKSKINAYSKDYNFSKEEIINILERYELKHNKTITEADKESEGTNEVNN